MDSRANPAEGADQPAPMIKEAAGLVNPTNIHDIDAEMKTLKQRARQATAQGAVAFARLLDLAEQRDSGQVAHVARFIAATYNGEAFSFNLFDLRALDIAISDDMLQCLDALRWATADLHTLAANGDSRVRQVIDRWNLHPDDERSNDYRAQR